MSATTEHKHHWQTTLHLDGCHWHTTSYVCGGRGPGKKCGAIVTVTQERDPKKMMSGFWMEPMYEEVTRDERGRFLPKDQRRWEEKICERCKELQAGAKVRFDMVLTDKDGNVLDEKHEEHDQRPDEEEEEDE